MIKDIALVIIGYVLAYCIRAVKDDLAKEKEYERQKREWLESEKNKSTESVSVEYYDEREED